MKILLRYCSVLRPSLAGIQHASQRSKFRLVFRIINLPYLNTVLTTPESYYRNSAQQARSFHDSFPEVLLCFIGSKNRILNSLEE